MEVRANTQSTCRCMVAKGARVRAALRRSDERCNKVGQRTFVPRVNPHKGEPMEMTFE
jgi:hypothetical protein